MSIRPTIKDDRIAGLKARLGVSRKSPAPEQTTNNPTNTPMPKDYLQFTKRTNYPKLGWLVKACKAKGLRVRVLRSERSFHAPISVVHKDDEAEAWAILSPVDDIADDAPRFRNH